MKFGLARTGNTLIVRVAGELDHHYTDEIRYRIDSEIMKPYVHKVVFDFNKLTFMDSSGIGMIVGRYKKIKAVGGSIYIMCNNNTVRKILEMSGVFQFAKICSDINDAV